MKSNLDNWNRTTPTGPDPGSDHFEMGGVNMLVFDAYKNELDELCDSTVWKGFSPRWTVPAKLRSL